MVSAFSYINCALSLVFEQVHIQPGQGRGGHFHHRVLACSISLSTLAKLFCCIKALLYSGKHSLSHELVITSYSMTISIRYIVLGLREHTSYLPGAGLLQRTAIPCWLIILHQNSPINGVWNLLKAKVETKEATASTCNQMEILEPWIIKIKAVHWMHFIITIKITNPQFCQTHNKSIYKFSGLVVWGIEKQRWTAAQCICWLIAKEDFFSFWMNCKN